MTEGSSAFLRKACVLGCLRCLCLRFSSLSHFIYPRSYCVSLPSGGLSLRPSRSFRHSSAPLAAQSPVCGHASSRGISIGVSHRRMAGPGAPKPAAGKRQTCRGDPADFAALPWRLSLLPPLIVQSSSQHRRRVRARRVNWAFQRAAVLVGSLSRQAKLHARERVLLLRQLPCTSWEVHGASGDRYV